MKNILKVNVIGRTGKRLLFVSLLCLFSLSSFGQLTPRPAMTWNGAYDVKMISSQGMQAVWLSNKNPLTAIRPLTDDEMAREYLDINNNVKLGGGCEQYIGSSIIPTMPSDAVGVSQMYADCDDDATTFQSSCAYLNFGSEMGCTTIKAAYLYWVGQSATDGSTIAAHNNVGSTLRSMPAGDNEGLGGNAYRTVLFKAPGDAAYTSVTADRYDVNPTGLGTGDRNICFADVTNLVKGKTGGLYWVANLRSGFDQGKGGAASGWTLVVIYTPPACPNRVIKFWDGMQDIDKGNSDDISFSFDAGDVPASSNSISYLGIAVLDGENVARYLEAQHQQYLAKPDKEEDASPEFLEFQSKSSSTTGTTYKINPFAPGQTSPFDGEPQPCYAVYDKNGVELSPCSYDGFSCSRISTYDSEKGTNGNDVNRLPAQRNTLGYDAHHLRLPVGAMVPNASNVTMTYYAGPQGGTSPFMVYMAIQTLQPEITLTKEALSTTVAPGGTFTYQLRAANKGPLGTAPNSTIVDTLDKTIDYVGNAKFLDKAGNDITSQCSASVVHQGEDENEVLTFTIPSIAAGDGNKANDSIRVQFDVKVKGLDRTDIWSYGCNRYVKNKASITYYAIGGGTTAYYANSNATAGCGGESVYLYTQVSSPELDATYNKTHKDTLDLGSKGASMTIISTIQDSLKLHLAELGLDVSVASSYKVYNGSGVEITDANKKFDASEGASQTFTAEYEYAGGCLETYYFTVNVKSMPVPTIPKAKGENGNEAKGASGSYVNGLTSEPGKQDAKVVVTVTNPDVSIPYYILTLTSDETGKVLYCACGTSGSTDFTVDSLKKGTYTVTITDNEGASVTQKVVVDDPTALSASVDAVDAVGGALADDGAKTKKSCKGSQYSINVNGTVVSEPDQSVPQYVWKTSTDNGKTWGGLENAGSLTYNQTPFTTSKMYKLYVCTNNNRYQVKDSIQINAIPTPKIGVVASDSGCYSFNLGNLLVENVNTTDDFSSSIMSTTFHGKYPISATDNSSQMSSSKEITSSQNVYVRMVADGLCYDVDTTYIDVLSMEECYPISVPEFFSPDGDGHNDKFMINDNLLQYDNPEIVIFDRYGKEVYRGGKEDLCSPKGWDGKYNGNDLASGDYWYQMTFKEIKPKVGHFAIKRRKQ